MANIDLDYLRQWVGREQTVEDFFDPCHARAMAAALDHHTSPSEGDALPPSWHWLYFLEMARRSAIGLDGHPKKGGFLPPIELPRRMWAGGSLQIAQPLRLGTLGSKDSKIRSIEHKIGKSGELVFVTIDHRYSQGGRLCIQEEQTLVYRAMPTERSPLPQGEHATFAAEWSATFAPDPVALFTFSALTLNAHRIHYDRDYATQKEFYAGLLVHAPLLVTLLLDLLEQQHFDETLRAFRFRAIRPTFDLTPVSLCGRREGRHVHLWTADSDNCIGLSATAVLGNAT